MKRKKKKLYCTDYCQGLCFISLSHYFMLLASTSLSRCTANCHSKDWFLGFCCIDIDYLTWVYSYCNGNVCSFPSRLMTFTIKTMLMLRDSYAVFMICPSLFRLSSWKTSESCKYECFWYFWKPKHLAARYWLVRLQLQLLMLKCCFFGFLVFFL